MPHGPKFLGENLEYPVQLFVSFLAQRDDSNAHLYMQMKGYCRFRRQFDVCVVDSAGAGCSWVFVS